MLTRRGFLGTLAAAATGAAAAFDPNSKLWIAAEMVGGVWAPDRKPERRLYDDYGDRIEED